MKRHEIVSSLFTSAGYDPTAGVLELEYKNGSCRRWLAVPAKTYQAFSRSLDCDAYFRQNIDGRFLSLHGESGPGR